MKKWLALVTLLFSVSARAQVTVSPMPNARYQFVISTGPVVGGQLFTCVTGSACPGTPQATWTDHTGSVQNANPVILDSMGSASIWLGPYTYKLVLEDASSNILWTVDGIQNSSLNGVLVVSSFPGATMGAQIIACNTAAVAVGGGTCDARSFQGAQTAPTGFTLGSGTQAVRLLLGYSSLTLGTNQQITQNGGSEIIGSGWSGSLNGSIIVGNTSNGQAIITTSQGANHVRISNVRIHNNSYTQVGSWLIDYNNCADCNMDNIAGAFSENGVRAWGAGYYGTIRDSNFQVGTTVLTGTVTTNGTAVTWASGATFNGYWGPLNSGYPGDTFTAPASPCTVNGLAYDIRGLLIEINGILYEIACVTDSTHVVLVTSAGVQGAVAYSILPGRAMVLDGVNVTTVDTVKTSGGNIGTDIDNTVAVSIHNPDSESTFGAGIRTGASKQTADPTSVSIDGGYFQELISPAKGIFFDYGGGNGTIQSYAINPYIVVGALTDNGNNGFFGVNPGTLAGNKGSGLSLGAGLGSGDIGPNASNSGPADLFLTDYSQASTAQQWLFQNGSADLSIGSVASGSYTKRVIFSRANSDAEFSGNVKATGIIDGLIPVTVEGGSATPCPTGTHCAMGSIYNTGNYILQPTTAASENYLNLPATVVGKRYCVENSTTGSVAVTGVISITPPASSYIVYKGVIGTISTAATTAGAAGDQGCFLAIDATHWELTSSLGTWTAN